MSYFPNCRTDEYYNDKYLNEKDKEFIAGYDWAIENAIKTFFANIDIYPELDDVLADNKAVIVEGKSDMVEEAMIHFAEMHRNELITSILDGYDEKEYEKLKASAELEVDS